MDSKNLDALGKFSGYQRKMLLGLLLVSGALLLPRTSLAQNLLNNGNFGTGDLSDWTVFTTGNGDLGSAWGLPDVTSFDVAGIGNPSNAAQFQAGEATFNSATGHTFQGGGISQTVDLSGGEYLVSADVAATDVYYDANEYAGLFTLLVDGNAVSSVALGQINPGQVLRNTLGAEISLSPGSHQVSVEITRPYLNGNASGASPLEYLDNIDLVLESSTVPEPPGMFLISFGLIGLWVARKSRPYSSTH
jgi:hypothetical protein